MATLVLTAVGTAIGGPIGGAVGALIGGQIDNSLFGPKGRDGPRLTELAVSTSSYGTPIARQFGTMRAGGSIIWATDLVESQDEMGGGKGQPSTTSYSYSTSFAVAISSRPIGAVGRIWADGNLLRGAAGDLKVGGRLRIHTGYGDQSPDPLLASAEGESCPAFRGLAYCVFESLELAEFGNRIPALSFEILADDGEVSITEVLAPLEGDLVADLPLAGLRGFADEGGSLRATLETLARAFPMACDASDGLALFAPGGFSPTLPTLPEAVVDRGEEGFGGGAGRTARRQTDRRAAPAAIRYYDIDRDYQAGLQRAGGRTPSGRQPVIEFPGSLGAEDARRLVDEAALRAAGSWERLFWRSAEIDPAIAPGRLVRVPGLTGLWRVESWEWRETGVELTLERHHDAAHAIAASDAGRSLVKPDRLATPTLLHAFELPWDGIGSPDERRAFAAASSAGAGWRGAALYAERGGALVSLANTGRSRAIIGTTQTGLPPSNAHLVEPSAALEVSLFSSDFALESCTIEELADGRNRALIGEEIVQFARADDLGGGRWRLATLLRGRGGTEAMARTGQPAGQPFALLDTALVPLPESGLVGADRIAALGIADAEPVYAPIAGAGTSRRPLGPVHPRTRHRADGTLELAWTRRGRGAWRWTGAGEPALVDTPELYEVGLGDTAAPALIWQTGTPALELSPATLSALANDHSGVSLWVRQVGAHDRSPALFLHTIA